MMKIMAIGTGLMLSASAFAAETTMTTAQLKQTATQEIAAPANASLPPSKTASDAALPADGSSSGILRLQDDFHSLKARQFLMIFGVQLQSYRPQGQSDTLTSSSYSLSSAGSTVLPSLSLGTLYRLAENRSGRWQLGLEAEAGYTSQKTVVPVASGSVNARLNTTLLEIHPLLRWAPGSSHWHLFAGYGMGHATVTQSGTNSLSQWSKSGNTADWFAGTDYAFDEKWLVHLTAKQMQISKADAGFDLPSNQVELGAKVLW
jgi:hypothetical protein